MCYFHKKRRIRHLWQLYWLAFAVVLTYKRSSTDFAKTLRWYGKVAILTAKRASWKTNICTQEELRLQISYSQKALCIFLDVLIFTPEGYLATSCNLDSLPHWPQNVHKICQYEWNKIYLQKKKRRALVSSFRFEEAKERWVLVSR